MAHRRLHESVWGGCSWPGWCPSQGESQPFGACCSAGLLLPDTVNFGNYRTGGMHALSAVNLPHTIETSGVRQPRDRWTPGRLFSTSRLRMYFLYRRNFRIPFTRISLASLPAYTPPAGRVGKRSLRASARGWPRPNTPPRGEVDQELRVAQGKRANPISESEIVGRQSQWWVQVRLRSCAVAMYAEPTSAPRLLAQVTREFTWTGVSNIGRPPTGAVPDGRSQCGRSQTPTKGPARRFRAVHLGWARSELIRACFS